MTSQSMDTTRSEQSESSEIAGFSVSSDPITGTPLNTAGLEQATGGLSLMIMVTCLWTIVAEIFLRGRDYWLIGVFFAGVIALLLSRYLKYRALLKELNTVREKK